MIIMTQRALICRSKAVPTKDSDNPTGAGYQKPDPIALFWEKSMLCSLNLEISNGNRALKCSVWSSDSELQPLKFKGSKNLNATTFDLEAETFSL